MVTSTLNLCRYLGSRSSYPGLLGPGFWRLAEGLPTPGALTAQFREAGNLELGESQERLGCRSGLLEVQGICLNPSPNVLKCTCGVKARLPQNTPPQHIDYFELKFLIKCPVQV